MMSFSKFRARAIYFLFGTVSLLAQVILLRRLLSVFYGNELTIGILFSGWMFWTGIAGIVFSRLSDRSQKPELLFGGLLSACAFIFIFSASACWALHYVFKFNPAVMPSLGIIVLIGFIISAPVCLLLGAGFNYASRMFEGGERNLVQLYLWEALGSAVIGIFFSFIMAGRISAFAQVIICGFLLSLTGALAFKEQKIRVGFILSAIVVFSIFLFFSGAIERKLVRGRWPGQEVLWEQESKYATLTITRSEGQVNFWINGLPSFSYPNPEVFEQLIHIPMAMCAKPDSVLLLGGGLLPSAEQIFKHPVKELFYLQIDPVFLELEKRYLAGSEDIISDPRVKIIYQDGRIFLSQSQKRFDVIILNLPDPETASLNRYYTQEFFQLVRTRLNPGGVFGLGSGISGNYVSDAEASVLANALITLKSVFPKIALIPLGRNYLVVGDERSALSENAEEILLSLKKRGVETRFVRDYYLRSNLSPERVQFIKDSARRFFNQSFNTDLRPRGYYLSILLWLEQANPNLRGLVKRVFELEKKPLWLGLLGYLLLGLMLSFWKARRALAIFIIFGIGWLGISAELVLMLGFQVAYGYVYHWLSLLISGFMVGLSLGAFCYQWFQGWFSQRVISGLLLMISGEVLVVVLSMSGLILLVKYSLGGFITLGLILLLLILVAIFSGMAFPLCAYLFRSEAGSGIGATAGWINAWDHLGSSFGALLTSLILIPLFGLPFSLWFGLLILLIGSAGILFLLRRS